MKKEWQDRFDKAFAAWAERSPETPPPRAAAEVVDRIERREGRSLFSSQGLRLATATLGLLLAVTVGWLTLRREPPPTEEIVIPPLDENVVLLWLDQQTPLYLTVAAPATKGES